MTDAEIDQRYVEGLRRLVAEIKRRRKRELERQNNTQSPTKTVCDQDQPEDSDQ